MNTSLQNFLQQRVASAGIDSVLRAMGYSERALQGARERVEAVLADPDLGLGTGRYDFRFSDREFLRALADVVDVDAKETDARIDAIDSELERVRQLFKPWIFVETHFKRSGEPIFALAWMESRRCLSLPVKACLLPRDGLTRIAAEHIREHYHETGGRLPLWGVIREYKLLVSAAEQVVMDREGNVLREEPRRLGGFAVLSLR